MLPEIQPFRGAAGFRVRLGPSGLHLFDRTSGLNVLFDEIILPDHMWSLAPRQVSIALTNSCDLRCPFCFAPKNRASLSLEAIASWLVDLNAHGTFGVGFGGGEPTLFPEFAELCAFAIKNTQLAVTFTTHGHWQDDDLIARLIGNVHFIRLSMDGVGETYRRFRGRGFSEFRARLESVRTVAPFGINYVVNDETLQDLNAASAIAAEAGAAELLLLPEEPANGRPGIDKATLASLRDWVTGYAGQMRLSISERQSDGFPAIDPVRSDAGLRA
jgi:pyruvate-formate lyase-activating enzyme